MPCNSDYLDATDSEVEASKVLAFLEELETGRLPGYYNNGFDKRVYGNQPEKILEEKVPILCSKLRVIEDITVYSPYLQVWWSEHRVADAKRLKEEEENKSKELDAKGFLLENIQQSNLPQGMYIDEISEMMEDYANYCRELIDAERK